MFKTYHVYHYRPDKQPRDVDTLIARQLYSAKTSSLNDPFEFAALSALSEHPEIQAEFRDAGVTCFCRSITNPLLWSHYAASHRGFAIGYDSAHSFFGGDKGLMGRMLHDVRYEDAVPTLGRFNLNEIAMAAVTTKPTCWAYEQEVRLIKKIGGEALNVPEDTIKELVFGAEMPDNRMNDIIRLVKNAGLNLKFAKMVYAKESYGVILKWI